MSPVTLTAKLGASKLLVFQHLQQPGVSCNLDACGGAAIAALPDIAARVRLEQNQTRAILHRARSKFCVCHTNA